MPICLNETTYFVLVEEEILMKFHESAIQTARCQSYLTFFLHNWWWGLLI